MTWAWSPGCWQHLGSPVLCSVSVHAMMLSGVGSVTQPGLYAPTEVVKEVLGHWIGPFLFPTQFLSDNTNWGDPSW